MPAARTMPMVRPIAVFFILGFPTNGDGAGLPLPGGPAPHAYAPRKKSRVRPILIDGDRPPQLDVVAGRVAQGHRALLPLIFVGYFVAGRRAGFIDGLAAFAGRGLGAVGGADAVADDGAANGPGHRRGIPAVAAAEARADQGAGQAAE